MLLTLSAKSLRPLLEDRGVDLDLYSLPAFAIGELGLHGLHLQTEFLSGWGLQDIDRLRDSADKAGCPWLTLLEPAAQSLTRMTDAGMSEAADRMHRVLRVAHRLGCSSVAMSLEEPRATPDALELAGDELRSIVTRAEQFELNLLLAPAPGLTERPDQVTELIRKVGGFRIGSCPDFEAAAASGDSTTYLRSLTPYASLVVAGARKFDRSGAHAGFDFGACVEAIISVGYEGTLALEYRGSGDAVEGVLSAKALVERIAEADQ